ncbi:hypothetical protein [Rhizobium fabae]|uniref:Uncharacterized protein n=1 Tax=Rhizobium fabae TaxID=573179 RepID=A0A7W6B6K9_9HYPH|nr:hypothetical protein [Rhizobium fabae]MBB3913037.1 hypothetical protein [Rhizobium fabae]
MTTIVPPCLNAAERRLRINGKDLDGEGALSDGAARQFRTIE